jgi:hypothetical protein
VKYKIIQAALDNAVDKGRVTACVKHYSDGKFDAVLYKHGSWVFPSASSGKLEDGRRHLTDLGKSQINFEVREMDDGNYVVAFNEKVFTVVLRDEFLGLREKIIAEAKATPSEEFIVGRKGAPEDHFYIGLFGRTRLLQDIQTPEVDGQLSPAK